ncbi:MAG TPA: glycosyltransferase family 4 protein [Bacteroidia bacterium]|nr:glycosyltransferase family 4 protein [Bacteroidia bacterium]HRD37734.1 glycosyltransferase family 4 protein [Bacteroidia bacterium]
MANKKTHIAFIIANSSNVPYFIWFAEKAKNNKEYCFSFISLHHSKPEMEEEIKSLGSAFYWIPFDHRARKSSMLKVIPKLLSLFKNIKPDIVHCHLFDDSLPSLLAAKFLGIKTRIITKQDTYFHWLYAPGIVKFDRLNNKLATHIVAVSEECKHFILEKEKAEASKVHLIHHGIRIDKLSKSEESIREELIERFNLKNKIVVGTIARLIDWKGHMLILDVAEQLIKKHPNTVFLFVGQGELKEKIEKTAEEKGISKNIILTGWIDREKIPSLFSLMDIYLHAAKYEPFGFVIAEAMLNAVPVLSTKTGAALDAIEHKENGYLVNYDSVNEFVDGFEFLLNADKVSIGEKGRLTAIKMYDFEVMWQSYINLYAKAILEL